MAAGGQGAAVGVAIFPKEIDVSGCVIANATQAAEMPAGNSLGPAGIGTKTVAMWLEVNVQGVKHYIPMWT